jgi:hypothetical protein
MGLWSFWLLAFSFLIHQFASDGTRCGGQPETIVRQGVGYFVQWRGGDGSPLSPPIRDVVFCYRRTN